MGMNNLLLPVFGVLNSDLDEGLIYIIMFSIRVKRIYTNLYCEVYMMKIRYFIFQVLQTSVFSFIWTDHSVSTDKFYFFQPINANSPLRLLHISYTKTEDVYKSQQRRKPKSSLEAAWVSFIGQHQMVHAVLDYKQGGSLMCVRTWCSDPRSFTFLT